MSDSALPHPLSVLEHAAVGAPITRVGVSLFPLYLAQQSPVSVLTHTPEALQITEADQESVPTLVVTSVVDDPVLLVEGETLAGGLQQRTLNVSVLVPPRASLEIPVSCVEAGRWGGSREFSGSSGQASRRVRRVKSEGVQQSLRRSGTKHSDQGAVWESVDAELDRLDTSAPAGSSVRSSHGMTSSCTPARSHWPPEVLVACRRFTGRMSQAHGTLGSWRRWRGK